jgi:signal transduction histidine kinase
LLVGAAAWAIGAVLGGALGAPAAAAWGGSAVTVAIGWCALLLGRKYRVSDAPPVASAHKRALDGLNEELTSLASPVDVVAAIERTVRRLVACDGIEFTFADTARRPLGERQGEHKSGQHQVIVHPRAKQAFHELDIALEFHGRTLGSLAVRRGASRERFSPDDIELVRAVAAEAGIALAHAVAYAELEKRRKQQVAAWRDEREALVETLSAEIAHEVRYPINFFRTIFQRASDSRVLEQEDIEIGCEEVDRLERLVAGLRRMTNQELDRRVVEVAEVCARAEVLLRDRMSGHPLIVDIDEGGGIHCDIDKITQVLVNLLANAVEAVEPGGTVGVEWRLVGNGGELSVWDTGSGFTEDPSRLFAPWYTTKPRGTGLGLAISYRLVRAHGWNIEATRREGKTVFVVAVPSHDVVVERDSVRVLPRSAKKGIVA